MSWPAYEVAVIASSDKRPASLYLYQQGGGKQLTRLNAEMLEKLDLAETRVIHYQAPDGWEIEGFVTLPPDFRKGKLYPTLLLIHGGPVGQYGHYFSFEAQVLAAQGYVVIRTNPRGSSGYGQAFTLGLYRGWGEKDYQDVLAGV